MGDDVYSRVRTLSSGLRPVVIEASLRQSGLSNMAAPGLTPNKLKVLKQEMTRLGCRPPLYCQGCGCWARTLVYGNEAQKREHLTAICRGEIRWAQGYSEPSAGSDLANLKDQSRGLRRSFLVNGTKIWTTKADEADWIFCLVRTSDVTRSRQVSVFYSLIWPLRAFRLAHPINQWRVRVLPDVFRQCKVPKANLVGELNGGWAVAKEPSNTSGK